MTKIVINGFGKFNNVEINFDAPVSLVYGHNEAGKSTMMGFIRSILFGFPTRSHMKERYEPIRGGLHGGLVILKDDQGKQYRIERYDKVKVTLDDGTIAGEDYLKQLLKGLTQDVFKNIFAFSLSELQEINTLQSNEISGYLFNAGTGAGAGKIIEAEKKLNQEMMQLFKPKGRNQEIQQLLKEMESSKMDLKRYRESITEYNQKNNELSDIEKEIDRIKQGVEENQNQCRWLEKCIKTYDEWLKLTEYQKELNVLPIHHQFPEDALDRFEKLMEEKTRLTVEINRKQAKLKELNDLLDGLDLNHERLGNSIELERAYQGLNLYEEAKKSVIEVQTELKNIENELDRKMKQIGKDWNHEQLRAFSTTVTDREEVTSFRTRFRACQSDKERLEQVILQNQERVDLLITQQNELNTSLQELENEHKNNYPWMSNVEWYQLGQYVKAFREECTKWSLLKNELKHLNERKKARSTSTLWVIGMLNMLIPAYFIWDEQWIFAIFSFVVLLGYNLLIGMKLKRDISSFKYAKNQGMLRLIEHEQQMETLLNQIIIDKEAATAAQIHIPLYNNRDKVDTMLQMNETIKQLDRITEYFLNKQMTHNEMKSRLKLQQDEIFGITEQIKQQQEKLEYIQYTFKQLTEEWNDWLGARSLPKETKADTVLEIFRLVEQANDHLYSKDKWISKLASLRQKIVDFEQNIRHQLKLSEQADVVLSLQQWKVQFEHQKSLLDQEGRLKVQIGNNTDDFQNINSSLEQTKQRIEQLWKEAKAENEQQFRLLSKQHLRFHELSAQIRHSEVFIEAWIGKQQMNELHNKLQNHNSDELEQELNMLNAHISHENEQLIQRREQRGTILNELEQLKAGRNETEILQRYEEQQTSFNQLAGQWASRALCLELFKKAKAVYEKEKQPSVMKNASTYFSYMTDHQFIRVMSPFGENRMMAERQNGESIDASFMSRGTAEQLYLAMRFALVDEYASTLSLPLIMDDIFVNFDSIRLKNSLRLLTKLNKSQQIILFTCHSHVCEAMKEQIPELHLIDMNSE